MLVLGINTVEDACDVALIRIEDGSDSLIAGRTEAMRQGHDARLAPLVAAVLKDANLSVRRLDRIAVIAGPGSFTGVRVGVAFARGLALVAGQMAVGVSSLEALDPLAGGRVLGVLPARRRPPDLSWWAQALVDGTGAGDPVEVDAEGLAAMARDADAVHGRLEGAGMFAAPVVEASPTARAAARLAGRLGDIGTHPPAPIYVRAPDAKPLVRS